jgi:hypothetical protein
MLLVCIGICLKSVLRYKFLIFGYLSSGHYIYGRKDVTFRGYISKPKGFREQKCLGNAALWESVFFVWKRASKGDMSVHYIYSTWGMIQMGFSCLRIFCTDNVRPDKAVLFLM